MTTSTEFRDTPASNMTHPSTRNHWLHLIVFASGFAGLGYQMTWARMLSVSLGHEIVAILAVLGAFFFGLSVGAFALGDVIRRSAHPALWYAALELVIGAWAIALVWLIPLFNQLVPVWIGEQPAPEWHWTVAFSTSLLLLLPATAAMGATLPALERVYVQLLGGGRYVGGVYAVNTFGAVLGTLVTTFALTPVFGLSISLGVFAAVNFACATGILFFSRTSDTTSVPEPAPAEASAALPSNRLLLKLLFTGLVGLAYEVLVIRVLSQVLEDTVFTFALVLSIYLLGTAAGAAIYQRRFANSSPKTMEHRLLVFASTACLLGSGALWLSDMHYEIIIQVFSRSLVSALGAEVAIALMVFLLPTIAMGMLFSHLAQKATGSVGLGRAIAANTLGAALAPMLAGVIVLQATGAQFALIATSLAYLLLLDRWTRPTATLAAVPVAIGIVLALMPPLRFVSTPGGGGVIDYREGILAAVAVVSDAAQSHFLKVNNHFTMGSTSSRFADHRQTHIPLLLHDNPHRVLYLGIGTGMTLNAAQYHPELTVTGVELVPEILEVLHHFGTAPNQNTWPRAPRLLASDARRYIVSGSSEFDVIIADQFHPSRDGAGALYTREHFEAIKQRLAQDGLFCQWLPLFQMDEETFKLIARTFIDRFPHVQVHLAHFSLQQPVIGLIGSKQPFAYEPDRLVRRVESEVLQQELVQLRLNSDLALYGGFIGDRTALARIAGDGELNTDDRTLVTYLAPGFAYRQVKDHDRRLVQILEALAEERGSLLGKPRTDEDQHFATRLNAYWRARDAYLRAGLGVDPHDDLATMLAKTQAPLLEVLRISDDFSPAYAPLLAMAEVLTELDREAGRKLLLAIDRAAPARREALALIQALDRYESREN